LFPHRLKQGHPVMPGCCAWFALENMSGDTWLFHVLLLAIAVVMGFIANVPFVA
jgi:hypothetical protein